MPLQAVEPQRLYRQIADQLRTLIQSGEFVAGSRLPAERDLAKLACVARVAAKRIDVRRQRVRDEEMSHWNLEPVADTPRPTRRF